MVQEIIAFLLEDDPVTPESDDFDDEEDFREVYHADPFAYEVRPERYHWKPWRLLIYHFGQRIGSEYFEDRHKAEIYGQKVVAAAIKLQERDPYKSWPHIWAWLNFHRIKLNEARPFQVQTRELPYEEAKALGYDTGEIGEFPIRQMSIQGSHIDYEESGAAIWILMLATEPEFRNQGRAKYLLTALKQYADREGKTVVPGTYTEEGEKYLKRIVKQMWGESLDDDDDLKEIYREEPDLPGRSDWKIELGTDGMLSVFFRNKLVGQDKHRTFRSARSTARWLLSRFDKIHPLYPFHPHFYADVWDWYYRNQNLIESAEDDDEAEDLRDVYRRENVIRGEKDFEVVAFAGKYYLKALFNAHPKRVEINEKDAEYLLQLGPKEFPSAAIMDFGCGAFEGPDPEGESE